MKQEIITPKICFQISAKEMLQMLSRHLAPRLERIIGGGVRSTYSSRQRIELADYNLFVSHSAPIAANRAGGPLGVGFDPRNLADVPDAAESAALGIVGEAHALLAEEEGFS